MLDNAYVSKENAIINYLVSSGVSITMSLFAQRLIVKESEDCNF
jgi:hypothetical protein